MLRNALLDPALDWVNRPSLPIQYPSDSTECIFMKRAIEVLAHAKYGPAWTGEEPITQLPELLPQALHPMYFNGLLGPAAAAESEEPVQWFDPPSRAVLERADDLLSLHRPDLNRPSRFGGILGGLGPRPLRFTVREWKIAEDLAKKERDDCLDALGRWFDLQKDIVAFSESGLLVSRLRPVEGGEFSAPVATSSWRCERYAVRFIMFMMHPTQPFNVDTNRHEWQWIFFTRASLKLALAKIQSRPTSQIDDGPVYESELLQHMRVVSKALGMTAESPPKKEVVEEAIDRLWDENVPLSRSNVKSMASFIRPLASRGGRNAPKSSG